MALAIRTHEQSLSPEQESLREEALRGFAASPKTMSPKFFTIIAARSCSS